MHWRMPRPARRPIRGRAPRGPLHGVLKGAGWLDGRPLEVNVRAAGATARIGEGPVPRSAPLAPIRPSATVGRSAMRGAVARVPLDRAERRAQPWSGCWRSSPLGTALAITTAPACAARERAKDQSRRAGHTRLRGPRAADQGQVRPFHASVPRVDAPLTRPPHTSSHDWLRAQRHHALLLVCRRGVATLAAQARRDFHLPAHRATAACGFGEASPPRPAGVRRRPPGEPSSRLSRRRGSRRRCRRGDTRRRHRGHRAAGRPPSRAAPAHRTRARAAA